MHIGRILFAGVLLTAVSALDADAQGPTTTAAPVGCTYATCALRIEPGFFSPKLVRGASGESVSRLGGFGGGVETLLAGPDSAASYAQRYVRASKQSSALGLIAGIAFAAVAIRTHNFERDANTGDAILVLTNLGFLIASIPPAVRAQRSLSRAIWWYNASLPH